MERSNVTLIPAMVAAFLCAGVAVADVVTINFEEFPVDNSNGPIPADRYADLGVMFNASDDGTTWDGLSNGDFGNWGLEGTNGPTFSGFNGDSYGLTMLFDTDICGFSLDASRSNGSEDGDSLTVEGWRDGGMVESITLNFAEINVWTTFALNELVDEVRLQGSGDAFHPYGVDNVQWCPVTVTKRKVKVGSEVGGDLSSLMFSDDDRLEVDSEERGGKHRTKVFINLSACSEGLDQLDLRVETGASRGGITTKLHLYDFDAGKWRKIDVFAQTRGDDSRLYANLNNPGRFVRDSDGKIRARLATVRSDRSYTIRIDHAEVAPRY